MNSHMKLHPEQCQNLPFPVGCRVWYDLRHGRDEDSGIVNGGIGANRNEMELESKIGTSEPTPLRGSTLTSDAGEEEDTKNYSQTLSFSGGFVSAVYLDLVASTILYEVTPIATFDAKQMSSRERNLFSEKELMYSPGSPVHVIPHNKSDASPFAGEIMIQGEVLLCRLRSVDDSVDTSNAVTTKALLQIKAALAQEDHRICSLQIPPSDSHHISTIVKILQRLLTITADNEALISTNIGASVSQFTSYENGEVKRLAASILETWSAVEKADYLLQKVLTIKQTLTGLSRNTFSKQQSNRQSDEIISALRSLSKITISLRMLEKTRIDAVVFKLEKHTNTTISLAANDLVKSWKALATKEDNISQNCTTQLTNHDKMHKENPPSCSYTIKVLHDDGRFHIEYDIPMDRVKHRHEDRQTTSLASGPTNLTAAMAADSHCVKGDLVSISNANDEVDQRTIPLTSPSTLTESDTTPDQSLQRDMYKRKCSLFDDQEQNLEQSSKRSCSKIDFQFARTDPNEGREIEDNIVTAPTCLTSSTNHEREDGEIVSMEKDSVYGLAETSGSPYTKNPTNFVKIPIKIAHIARIIGSNGESIRDIQRKTGCTIDIRGQGNTRRGYDSDNEPLHAKISGNTFSAIDAATSMIRAIMAEIDGCSYSDSNKGQGLFIATSSSGKNTVVELNNSFAHEGKVVDDTARVDPLDHSNNRIVGCTNLSSVYCKLYIPPWLVYDDSSKARLHHYLQNHDQSISGIGYNTNCTIDIVKCDPTALYPCHQMYLLMKSNKNGSFYDAKQNIGRAKEDVENILLDYIHHDGSKGRLLYDIAISCSFFHGYIYSNSTSVHQRNPFSDAKNREYMDVVELPYFRNPTTNKNDFIGHFLMCKHTGVLSEIRHKTGCTIKICGDIFNVPVKYCDPYVFVYGEEKHRVDEAVQIVVHAIKEKVRTSSDLTWKEDGQQRKFSLKVNQRIGSY